MADLRFEGVRDNYPPPRPVTPVSAGQWAPAAEEIPWREYLNSLKANKGGILSIIFIFTSIGALYANSAKPIYVASTTILVEPERPKIVSIESLMDSSYNYLFYETQKKIILSRGVSEMVVEKLKLGENRKFTGEGEAPGGLLPTLFSAMPEEWFNVSRRKEESKVAAAPDNLAYARELQGGVMVKVVKDSQIITISYEANDSALAAEITNALADAYIESGMEARLAMARKSATWLNDRLGDLRAKLSDSEEQLKAYQASEGMVDTQSMQDVIRRKLGGMTEKLVSAQAERVEAEIRYRQVEEAAKSKLGYDSLKPVLQHPLIMRLKEDVTQIERRMAELDQRYGPKHPAMIRTRSDLEETRGRLKTEIGKVVEGIRKEYEVALENEKRMASLGEDTKKEIRLAGAKEFELAKKEREVATNRKLYETFLSRFKETDITMASDISSVRIIDRAIPPMGQYKPDTRTIIKLWFFMGAIVGVMFALVRDYFNQTFRVKDDIERVLHIPGLAAVPYMKTAELDRYIRERELLQKPNDRFAETIKNIRTGIVLSSLDNPAKIVMITSAVPHEGKTSIACNLSMSFAHLGRTLLMDLDLRKPKVGAIMKLPTSPGLTELLSGMAPLKAAIRKDPSHPNMDFITGGASAPNPLEIISSRKFSDTLAEIRSMYDHIIIDTPPVLLFSDALMVGQMADAIIMVIKAEETFHSACKDALKRLRGANLSPFGGVLSHVSSRRPESGYYYHYYKGYYDGRGAGQGK
jgi:capsular exopolysaccharide synthesis family protein